MNILEMAIAAKMGGGGNGGGSGGVTSWNDLKDKPFDKAVENVCFVDNESRTSVLDSTYGAYAVYLNMVLEKMYRTEPCIVTWDGTTKTHNPVDMELMGMKFTAYGNVGMFAAFGVPGENTGEPYVLVFMENGYSFFFTADMSATDHTVSVIGKTDVYYKMEQGYIDIPFFDLVEMGLPNITSWGRSDLSHRGETKTVEVDTKELINALNKGMVKVRFSYNNVFFVAVVTGCFDDNGSELVSCQFTVPMPNYYEMIWFYVEGNFNKITAYASYYNV